MMGSVSVDMIDVLRSIKSKMNETHKIKIKHVILIQIIDALSIWDIIVSIIFIIK